MIKPAWFLDIDKACGLHMYCQSVHAGLQGTSDEALLRSPSLPVAALIIQIYFGKTGETSASAFSL